jgi:hypothetical protein
MGRDIRKSERQYEFITFSDVDCIKGLIKKRSMIDEFCDTQHNASMKIAKHWDTASDAIGEVNSEVIAIYVTLDDLINKCGLNWKQRYIINKLMIGWTEQDLAEFFKTEPKMIASTLNTIANKIKRINDLDWKYNYIYMNILPAKFLYKTCTKCDESKAATDDFYGKDNRNKDGFKSICRKCNAMKSKGVE